MNKPKLMSVPVCQIAPAPSNPNEWDPKKFEHLKQSMEEEGCNSAIVLRALSTPVGTPFTVYQICDGEHRWKAASAVGIEDISAYVYEEGECSDAKARAIQVGFNNLRGAMNLTEVAKTLAEFDLSGMEHLAGYTPAEVLDLTTLLVAPSAEDLLGDGMAPAPMVEPDPDDDAGVAAGVFELTISLPTAADLRNVRKALKAAGGKAKDPGKGLLKVLGLS